ncbi:hypothetical protein HYH03_005295 [Edaphochlamys debaryana]|uniref:Uncharacterized protein n=1 Tax=Edaphochlamys debaryana TaxID=47281 RepID=A0A836C2A2_9CHLO|nr:hypothetical protein HYH03_005295 [Edaphochlamys debaryana]|eukprot:KAG2496468.1 hypothetical protein HYH03_005295 [Edaphochlamys debaryana]
MPHNEPPYASVLTDSKISKKLNAVGSYLLGSERNHARRIRDISAVLPMYTELGVSCWSYWALLVKALMLALNCTAIFFALLTYKSPKNESWHFEVPTRAVVFIEFLGIAWYLAWFLGRTLQFFWEGIQECRAADADVYYRNLKLCSALRMWYKSALRLDFNLLLFVRYLSPPAVIDALRKARRRVYGRYGTRVHRQNCCVDCLCCCCFYGRLACCSVLNTVFVVVCVAVSLLAVLIKILQLRFLGDVNIQNWSITELLLFGQFLVNLICLDTRQKAKRKGKLELLFDGADAQEAVGERKAKTLVENLALLVLRYRFSLLAALAVHHSLSADDVNYLYIQDDVEKDKPRNRVKHEYPKPKPKDDSDEWAAGPPPPPQGPHGTTSYNNPEWAAHYADGGAGAYPPGYGPAGYEAGAVGGPHPLYPGQVVVQISPREPRRRATNAQDASPPPMAAGPGPGPGGQDFPYSFYTHGHAVGAPVHGYGPPAVLKGKYEAALWGVQAS